VPLIRARAITACSFLQKRSSSKLVAIIGSGGETGSTGMEVWNPADGSINLLVDVLPPEQQGNPLMAPSNK